MSEQETTPGPERPGSPYQGQELQWDSALIANRTVDSRLRSLAQTQLIASPEGRELLGMLAARWAAFGAEIVTERDRVFHNVFLDLLFVCGLYDTTDHFARFLRVVAPHAIKAHRDELARLADQLGDTEDMMPGYYMSEREAAEDGLSQMKRQYDNLKQENEALRATQAGEPHQEDELC